MPTTTIGCPKEATTMSDAICIGHSLDTTPGGVHHVCTELCTTSSCCRTTITVTVLASAPDEGVARVEARLPEGFAYAGRAYWRSQRHGLVTVELTMPTNLSRAERDDAWVRLTSYGITPSDDLGSRWAKVKGVGC